MSRRFHRVLTPAILIAGVCDLTAATLCVNREGTRGCLTSIGTAVNAAAPGDLILVEGGTYNEMVVIGKPITLLSMNPLSTAIDATGYAN